MNQHRNSSNSDSSKSPIFPPPQIHNGLYPQQALSQAYHAPIERKSPIIITATAEENSEHHTESQIQKNECKDGNKRFLKQEIGPEDFQIMSLTNDNSSNSKPGAPSVLKNSMAEENINMGSVSRDDENFYQNENTA